MDRVGSCDFTFVTGDKKLHHKVPFNTTEPKKASWLDGIKVSLFSLMFICVSGALALRLCILQKMSFE